MADASLRAFHTPEEVTRLAGMRLEDALDEIVEYERIPDEAFPPVDFSAVREMSAGLVALRRGGADESTIRETARQLRRGGGVQRGRLEQAAKPCRG